MLRTYVKIGLMWVGIMGIVVWITFGFPHREIVTIQILMHAFDLLIAVCCLFVAKIEINKRVKAVFIYTSIFFLFSSLSGTLSALVGKAFFQEEPYASFYWKQYGWAAHYFLLLFVVAFGTYETVSRSAKILRGSLFCLIVAGGATLYFFYPIFLNSKYLYATPEIRDYVVISDAIKKFEERGEDIPTPYQLAKEVSLPDQGQHISFAQKYERVSNIFPYLGGKNYIPLIYKPLYLNSIYMSFIGLLMLLAVLSYWYWNDHPKSAYLEKILIAFIPVCVLECLHSYAFLTSTDFQMIRQLFNVGGVLSRLSFGVVFIFIIMRLNFISSPIGSFYESKLNVDPSQVSRWRDFLDEFIIRRFLNSRTLGGRLFFRNDPPEPTSTQSTLNQ